MKSTMTTSKDKYADIALIEVHKIYSRETFFVSKPSKITNYMELAKKRPKNYLILQKFKKCEHCQGKGYA